MDLPNLDFNPKKELSIDLEVIDLEYVYQRAASLSYDPSKPHRNKFHWLLYVSEGQGSHFIDFNDYSFQAGDFILVNQGQAHAFDFVNRPQGKMILFTESFVSKLNSLVRIPLLFPNHIRLNAPVVKLSETLKDSCKTLVEELVLELERQNTDDLVAKLLFSTLQMLVLRDIKLDSPEHLSEQRRIKFMEFANLIAEHHMQIREGKFYADLMGMTYKSLNQLSKQAVNQTAKQLIDTYTILELKRCLVIDDASISDLTYEFQFFEDTNFVKYFKKHTKLTPIQFKKQFKS